MAIPWVEIFIFPGFLFVLGLAILFEQITSRLYSRFSFKPKGSPMFIPIVEHFKLCFKGEKERINTKSVIQSILLLFFLTLSLTSALILPICVEGEFSSIIGVFNDSSGKTTGIVGIISFEGDLLLLLTISTLIGVLIFFILWIGEKHSTYEALKIALTFMLFDIPLFLAFVGPSLVRRSMNISILAEDIRLIAYENRGFGIFLLIPWGALISIFALTFKFDQPYFDRLNSTPDLSIRLPTPKNWKFHVWNTSMRVFELVLAGVIVSVFLGGSYVPIPILDNYEILGHLLNFLFKLSLVMLITTIIKTLIPRLKTNQAINVGFKILAPCALITVLVVGGTAALLGIS
ncbi:MAG: NADH-quinone oxidoreductase subunit H [Candidatus Heimdallarchaeota archaeon]